MKLQKILNARAVRLMQITSRPLHMLDAVSLLREQYKFVKSPQSLEEYDVTKGIIFSHGKFSSAGRDIVIDSFQVYSNGLLVDTREDTDESDNFIDDALAWGVQRLGMTIPEQQIERVYASSLVVSLNTPLAVYAPIAQQISSKLSSYLSGYGLTPDPFETASLSLNFDRSKSELPKSMLANFTIERREGVAFDSNLYFCTAPLKTKDHIALLQEIDG